VDSFTTALSDAFGGSTVDTTLRIDRFDSWRLTPTIDSHGGPVWCRVKPGTNAE